MASGIPEIYEVEPSFYKKMGGGVQVKKAVRPKKIKCKIGDLIQYLDNLPESHPTKRKLTPDRYLIIKRYVEELQHLETVIARLKLDIYENGEIEIFEQGKQCLRRANPSMDLYFSSLRQYRLLVTKINELLYGVTVVW